MALRASHRRVHSGKRIVRKSGVIEFRVKPIARRVAGRAIVRQSQLHMRRVIRTGEIGRVTGETIHRCALEHVVHVA